MQRPPVGEIGRLVAFGLSTILLSIVGLGSTTGWELYGFLLGVGLLLGLGAENLCRILREARFIEPPAIRKRCHRLLGLIAETVFPEDASLQITVFVPDGKDGDFSLVPIVRYEPTHPKKIDPTSKASFKVNSGSLISEAWRTPGKLAWKDLEDCDTADKAKGFFMFNLGLSQTEVDHLSEHTLLRVKCLGNIALRSPIAKGCLGIVSLSSVNKGALDLKVDGRIEALSRHLEMVANLLAPMD